MKHKGCEEREEGRRRRDGIPVAKSTCLAVLRSVISTTVTTEQGGDVMQSPAPHPSIPVRFGPARRESGKRTWPCSQFNLLETKYLKDVSCHLG